MWLVPRLKVRNEEDFSYIKRAMLALCQPKTVKKTSFPQIESSGSIVINIPEICAYKRAKRLEIPAEWRHPFSSWRNNQSRIEKIKAVHDMSGCSIDQKVKYTAGSFVGKALTCHEMQKLESELWKHAMVGAGHAAYTDRFHELARLVPYLVTPESRMIERYVYGLASQIRGMVAATETKTI
ncbi:hypothetical protein Tco_0808085 [Tanacetum coccineum]